MDNPFLAFLPAILFYIFWNLGSFRTVTSRFSVPPDVKNTKEVRSYCIRKAKEFIKDQTNAKEIYVDGFIFKPPTCVVQIEYEECGILKKKSVRVNTSTFLVDAVE